MFLKIIKLSLFAIFTTSCTDVYTDSVTKGYQSDSQIMTNVQQTTLVEEYEDKLLCNDNSVSEDAIDQILSLTSLSDSETVYSTYERIDKIASLFEDCSDPWGMFPTAYRHITNRIIEAIENEEIEDQEWARRIVLDFASRYMENLQLALLGEEPSYAWEQYYYLADHPKASRTRAVVIAMVAHLTLDLPYSLVEIETTEDHKDDYFVLGELMIEITPDFIEDLRYYYDTDAEDLLNGFFFGDWVDGAYGQDTTITLSYQTIRTKSWNNRWYLEQWWGGWIAESEIYTAFWTIDGVLATLDATGTI
tara:strand:- start:548 stop:1465 length:918 start_codon:yes stop_codon:yes gene_type:complete